MNATIRQLDAKNSSLVASLGEGAVEVSAEMMKLTFLNSCGSNKVLMK